MITEPQHPQPVAVVIPAYDCCETIADAVSGLPSFVSQVYVVDDGNRGATRRAVDRLPLHVVRLRHESNQGVGAAMLTGYARALRDRAAIIIKIDADCQMDPTEMIWLKLAIQGGAEYAKGTRWQTPRSSMPWIRRAGTRALSWWAGVEDVVNGYTAITADALRKINWHAIDMGYGFELSMILELKRLGLRIANVPIPARYGSERSHLRPWHYAVTFPRVLKQIRTSRRTP